MYNIQMRFRGPVVLGARTIETRLVTVFGKDGKRRAAQFKDQTTADECCRVIDQLTTASHYLGAERVKIRTD